MTDRPVETGVLRFNLDEPFGRTAMKRAVKALDLALALSSIREYLHKADEYDDPPTFEVVKQNIRDIIDDYVDLSEVLE